MIGAFDLGEALARIAAALHVPVMIGALLALLACALELGRFAGEAWRRARLGRGALAGILARGIAEPRLIEPLCGQAPTRAAGAAAARVARAVSAADRTAAEHALADFELAVQRRLDRTRILVRAGPAIGLMGTLIPLAPGLAALGRGDVPALAEDLRSAFGATVIGLLVGTVAYALTLTRTRLYTEDLAALERAAGA
ncbi:MotA/TolQ/ExbB proton channel family protein [Candidatus Solirubrobacter pratensis]|uniref:MotA/TolQ/ExbB proton channel family protein n=1 Tax=Candidatus Solirubrobacter pratensis TaxID=1298857 RepID=UPI000400A072|nr:MotA/TolQ/ExbB proton channel family protein [Candidatus Solirubrobacter pratensis]